jgi:hypothetical protein
MQRPLTSSLVDAQTFSEAQTLTFFAIPQHNNMTTRTFISVAATATANDAQYTSLLSKSTRIRMVSRRPPERVAMLPHRRSDVA